MVRKHNYEAPPDYGLHIDRELEKTNAQVRAQVWRETPRMAGESGIEHLRRVTAAFHSKKKTRDAYGKIV